jgi:hypothetical protein
LILLVAFGTAAAIALAYITPRQSAATTAATAPVSAPSAPPAVHQDEPPTIGTRGAAAAQTATAADERTAHAALEVEVDARGPCWLAATADGERVVYRVLRQGEHVSLHANNELELHIGDAGNFQYSINGLPGRRLADPGDDITLRLTPSNFRRFVRAPQ